MALNIPLRTAMMEAGLKQYTVGQRAGIHEARMSKIARGHVEPTPDEKKALARILKKPIAYLFPSPEVTA